MFFNKYKNINKTLISWGVKRLSHGFARSVIFLDTSRHFHCARPLTAHAAKQIHARFPAIDDVPRSVGRTSLFNESTFA
jgi:hypothetical protein